MKYLSSDYTLVKVEYNFTNKEGVNAIDIETNEKVKIADIEEKRVLLQIERTVCFMPNPLRGARERLCFRAARYFIWCGWEKPKGKRITAVLSKKNCVQRRFALNAIFLFGWLATGYAVSCRRSDCGGTHR